MTGKIRIGSTPAVADPDESFIMEVSFDDGSRRIPVNQIMLMFDQTVGRAAIEKTITRMLREQSTSGLKLAGQIPNLGIYQFIIDNDRSDPAEALAVLDGVVTTLAAYDGVNTVSYKRTAGNAHS